MTNLSCCCSRVTSQDDLRYLEADENKNLDFLAGGGQPPRDGLEHFPQLWCPNGTYSAHGQVFLVPLSQVGYCGEGGFLLQFSTFQSCGAPLARTRRMATFCWCRCCR